MSESLDALVDELYALPLERFVAERGVLAKALRAQGRRDEGAQVAALRKPSVVAWAVNQIVRAQPETAATLWAAGDAVVEAQQRVVAGRGPGRDLRTAVEAERRALAPLADAARGLLTGSGRFLGEQNVQVVIETLHAAAVDPSVRGDVARGRLSRPLQFAGVGGGRAPADGSPTPAGDETVAASRRERTARRAADAAAEADQRRADRQRRARKDAARRALVRAERARDKARERIAGGVRERDDAAARLEHARRALEQAEATLAADHQALERAEEAVEAARAEVESA